MALQLPIRKPETSNEQLFDALVRHQVFLLRFSASIRNKAVAILNEVEPEMAAMLRAKRRLTRRGAEQIARRMVALRDAAWDSLVSDWGRELRAMVRQEVNFALDAVQRVTPAVLDLRKPEYGHIVAGTVFEGRTLGQWFSNMRARDRDAITSSLRRSLTLDDTPRTAAQRLIGTRRAAGRNGALQATRNSVATIARTAVTGMSTQARHSAFEINRELFPEERFTAVLDGHTTPICRSEDGNKYPVGEGPQPPLHHGCRSIRIPIIDGEEVGNRTSTPLFMQRVLNDFTDANGLPRVTSRGKLPRGFKGKFDAFRRERAFEVVGNEPLPLTYEQWIGRQPVQFQNDVLGVTKARLFREGGLSLDQFVDGTGRELTLKQLAQRDAAAFVAAGLDPVDFAQR